MFLSETAKMMLNVDYKERFKAEYWQLKIRYDKLCDLVKKWQNNELDFQPTCPREIYDRQLKAMNDYLQILIERANLEKISLKE